MNLYAVTISEDDPGPMLGPDPIYYALIIWAKDGKQAIEQAENYRDEPSHRIINVIQIPDRFIKDASSVRARPGRA